MTKILLLTAFAFLALFASSQVSWQNVNIPNENVASVTVSSNNTVYIGTNTYGVFRSQNDGINWTDISVGLGDSAIAQLQSASDDKIFAATASHGIYQYAANAWTAINNGLPVNNGQP